MSQPLKVIVFGATGQTGVCIVRALLAAGYQVTAFVRNPAKATALGFGPDVRLIQGDGRDADVVIKAVAGQNAVVAAVGPRSLKRDDIQEAFTTNLVKAMAQSGVKRLVDLSARGAGDSIKHNKLFFTLFQKTVLKHVYEDKDKAEALILTSDLDYTLVRPGILQNKLAKGGVRASLDGKVTDKNLSMGIARDDVAHFMVAQLGNPTWVRQAPLIGY